MANESIIPKKQKEKRKAGIKDLQRENERRTEEKRKR
jgi:hypothetical protein